MKRLLSIFFALLILWVSLDLGIASHFCGGKLAQVKLIYGSGEAGCGMDCSPSASKDTGQQETLSKPPCCIDSFLLIASGDFQADSHSSNHVFPAVTFPFHETSVSGPWFSKNLHHPYPLPPLLSEVFLSFIQVFLI